MKHAKITVFVKELPLRSKRERKYRILHIATTLLIGLSISTLAIFLGCFVHDNVRKMKILILDGCYFSISSNPFETLKASDNNRVLSDEELMWQASMVRRVLDYPNSRPKVAFMFLSRGRLRFAPLWEKFFKGYEGFYSIYHHSSPEFNNEAPNSSVFYNSRIPSKQVEWGESTMVDAERRLLANALLDLSNERFILLSESCIPLFNFTTIYNYLINSRQSFLASFDDPTKDGRGRYNPGMSPTITLSDWRKGSQWFEMHRKVAIEIIVDQKYYPIFNEYCKPPCYMDEHYLSTFVTKIGAQWNSNRSLTWVDWSKGGPHPTRFVRKDVSEKLLNSIRFSNGFNCTYNGGIKSTTTICFLFARKFHQSSLEPLLRIMPKLLGFHP
ncbi:hypothetical protein ACFE04_016505 [Oxalis oulophora]